MPQSLKSRFNGKSLEVVDYARRFGVNATMQKYDVKDYIAMHNFLKHQAPDEYFQVAKVDVGSFSGPDAFDRLLDAWMRHDKKRDTTLAALVAENTELKRQVNYYKGVRAIETMPKVEAVFEYCEE